MTERYAYIIIIMTCPSDPNVFFSTIIIIVTNEKRKHRSFYYKYFCLYTKSAVVQLTVVRDIELMCARARRRVVHIIVYYNITDKNKHDCFFFKARFSTATRYFQLVERLYMVYGIMMSNLIQRNPAWT